MYFPNKALEWALIRSVHLHLARRMRTLYLRREKIRLHQVGLSFLACLLAGAALRRARVLAVNRWRKETANKRAAITEATPTIRKVASAEMDIKGEANAAISRYHHNCNSNCESFKAEHFAKQFLQLKRNFSQRKRMNPQTGKLR